MVLVPEPARVSIDSIIDSYLANMTVKLDNLWSDTRCLTLDLGNRLSNFTLDDNDNVKVMLAVSGGGKTRTLLELLYKQFGMYFVANKISSLIGSLDLEHCAKLSVQNVNKVDNLISILVHSRFRIMRWFIDNGQSPEEWLYAQLYPVQVFGCDFFLDCYKKLVEIDPSIGVNCIENLIAVDEVQEFVDGETARWKGFTNSRPFVSPIVRYMKTWTKKFVLSGTGINYSALQVAFRSSSFKSTPYDIVNINGFPFLDEGKIYEYSSRVIHKRLNIMGKPHLRIHEAISRKISQNILCHGRPRLTASVIDTFFEKLNISDPSKSLNLAFLQLERFVYGQSNKSLIRFIDEEADPFRKIIGDKTFKQVVTDMFVNSLVQGKGEFLLHMNEKNLTEAAEMVSIGVGCIEIQTNDVFIHIILKEPAVREYLSVYLDFKEYVQSLMDKICTSTRNTMIGDWFEYIVAAALIRKYGVKGESMKRSILPLDQYLSQDETKNTYHKPDDKCGPDIVLKIGKIVWIVQVRCVKRFYRQYRLNSAETVDPNRFYTVRKRNSKSYGKLLKGYEMIRNNVISALQNYEIRKVVVASTRVKIPMEEHPDILWISQNLETGKDFFEPINGNPMAVWKILEEQCNVHADFEQPNCEDPDNLDDY